MRALVRSLVIVTVCGMAACDDSTPSVPPTAPSSQPQSPSLVRTTLTPDEVSFMGTGQSALLSVMAVFSDGTTRDITSAVNWQIDQPDVVSIDGGRLTGRGYGTTRFSSEYQGKFVGPGYAHVRIPAELLVPLTGVIRDQYGRPVPGARVVGTGGIALGGTADANGAFDLGLTYGPIRLALSKFGHATTESALTVGGGPMHAELTLPESPSPYVEHIFEAEGRSAWHTHRIEARAGGSLDVLVESLACSYRHTVGVLTVRLRSGGVLLQDDIVGCSTRATAPVMARDDAQLDVTVSSPATYRVTFRLLR